MNYPDWAPEELIDWAKMSIEFESWESGGSQTSSSASLSQVCEKAITDTRLEKVWKSYRTRCFAGKSKEAGAQMWKEVPEIIVMNAWTELFEPLEWDSLTKAEKKKYLEKFSNSLMDVKALLRIVPFELFVSDYLTPDQPEQKFHVKEMPAYFGTNLFRNIDKEQKEELAAEVSEYVLSNCGSVLKIIEGLLEKTTTEFEALNSPQVVDRPNMKNARVTKFVRNACLWNREKFGLPLYENVAILASVFLEEEIDTKMVIESFRAVKNVSGLESQWGRTLES
jgi:hypothetical protein